MMKRLVIWVTSVCNLSCKFCNQRYTMDNNPEYQMSIDEVKYIVNSCLERGIHFDIIEITGGEPSLWENITEGVPLLNQITKTLTLVTNGNNPDLIISLGLKGWGVSATQATKEQLAKFDRVRDRAFINGHTHKQVPFVPIEDSLPAACCVRGDPDLHAMAGEVNSMMYIRGNVYYCNCAFALQERIPLNEDVVCKFEDDFVAKFINKQYDQEMCKYCLCNSNVWNKI
jgi:hypothetical protein